MGINNTVVIVAAIRTPMGGMQGELANVTAPELGSVAIKARRYLPLGNTLA